MAFKKVSISQLPAKIKFMVTMHQDPSVIDLYECQTKQDIYDLSAQYPMETTAIANNPEGSKIISGYFLIGLALPSKADNFRKVVLAYYYMGADYYRQNEEDIRKEIGRRKKLYSELEPALKNIKESRQTGH
jgi:hypothetical protein